MLKNKNRINESNISYYISVDMELQPGKTLDPEKIKKLKCNRKWNSVRKSYSEMTGQPYIIKPDYTEYNKNNENNENKYNEYNKNYTRSNRENNNKTKKYRHNPMAYNRY